MKLRRNLAWQLKVTLALMAIMGVLGSVLARGDVTAKEVASPPLQTPTATPLPPRLTASPTTVLPNELIIVTGTGFTTGGSATIVSITIGGVGVPAEKVNDGNGYASVKVDTAGNFNSVVIIPVNSTTLTTGSHTVTALDSGSRSASATVSFQSRSLKVAPQTSRRGSRVTVTGTGFPASSTRPGAEASPSINIRYEISGRDPRGVASALANTSGEFTASFTVPLDAPIPSANTVRALIAGTSVSETGNHSVPDRAIKVSPDSGPPGSSIILTGTNFPAFTQARSLTIGRIQVLASHTPVTDGEGGFTASVVVPELAVGTEPVAVEVGDTTALISFRVTAPVATPTPTGPAGLASTLGPLGANLVRVWGYDAKKQRFQLYDPATALLSDLTTLTRGRGYWILVNRDQIITLGSSSYDLSAGWNLIGWLG